MMPSNKALPENQQPASQLQGQVARLEDYFFTPDPVHSDTLTPVRSQVHIPYQDMVMPSQPVLQGLVPGLCTSPVLKMKTGPAFSSKFTDSLKFTDQPTQDLTQYVPLPPKTGREDTPIQYQSYNSPEATPCSTPVNTPPRKRYILLSQEAQSTLREVGIPEKAIKKLEVIIHKTNENYAICGSAALAIHTNHHRLALNFEVGDLDIVYTGETNTDFVAFDLQGALGSPNTKANTAQGQILIAVLTDENNQKFKIDLVPKKEEFATEFAEINGLSIASLSALKTSYACTASGHYGEKSDAAKAKLETIQVLLDQEHSICRMIE